MTILTNTEDELLDYRVKRLAEHSDLMQAMTRHPIDGSDALFENYSSLLTVCALIGFNHDSFDRTFLKRQQGEPIQRQFFQKDQRQMMDLIAIAHAKDVKILKSCQKYDIFSAYASAGFDILCKILNAKSRDWTDSKVVNECAMVLAELYSSEDTVEAIDALLR